MKSFNEFLDESSISRVWNHTQNRNVGIITAHRGEMSDDEKLHANRNLEADIRDKKKGGGFGFIHVKGRYIENRGTPTERTVEHEHSYVVTSPANDGGKLKGFLNKAGAKYGQESVVWKPHDRPNASFLYTSPTKDHKVGDEEDQGPFHPRKIKDYHSRLMHSNKSFSFAHDDEVKEETVPELEYSFWRNMSPLMMGRERLIEF